MGILNNAVADAINRYNQLYSETSILCETHSVNLVKANNLAAFCPLCAKEKLAADELELREKETAKAENYKKRWLKTRSIVTDPKMFNMKFDNFDTMDKETTINKEKALDMARRYYKGAINNELLTGKFGTGKTHLAMAILNQLNEHANLKAAFVSTDEMMRKIKSSFGNDKSPYKEDLIVNTLIDADILVLDDLGAEVGSVDRNAAASDFTVRVINAILNGRTNKPTIVTTNLNSGELKQVYDGRLLSRLFRGVEQENIITFKETTDKRTKLEF